MGPAAAQAGRWKRDNDCDPIPGKYGPGGTSDSFLPGGRERRGQRHRHKTLLFIYIFSLKRALAFTTSQPPL